ncbi:MAG: hypothetical protein M1814_002739 [Vezdaea aestivalis]|nr:MAG: hypothetical protein M1814_002739 [Vezdaea aestivalis]
MASYDYYNSASSPTRPNKPSSPDYNAPLPPTPSESLKPSRINTSPPPLKPPYHDTYSHSDSSPYSRHHQDRIESDTSLGGDSAYHGPIGRTGGHHNQYSDDVPLRPFPSKGSAESPQVFETGTQLPSLKKKKGIKRFLGSGKEATTWICYIFFLVDMSVFIAEIAKNAVLTGSPIMTQPSFNPMIGPSPYVLINMGARFVPCMRTVPEIENSPVQISWHCPRSTTNNPDDEANKCSLSDLCGFGGFPDGQPNQWWRFLAPIFLHAGIIHIGFNMLLQLTLGRDVEKKIGSIRFALVYFSAGTFGFVMGGNFAPTGIASTGASGCIFGVLALFLLDLLYTWGQREKPWKDLAFIGLDIVISFVLGLLPGLDNFSHIGGFLTGLVLGVCLLRSPNKLQERIGGQKPYVSETLPFEPMRGRPENKDDPAQRSFVKERVGFFKGRKPLWWAWWLVRVAALVGVLVGFIVLINNFYKYRVKCGWCKYLSCLPIKNWCELGNLSITSTNTTKRDLLSVFDTPKLGQNLF